MTGRTLTCFLLLLYKYTSSDLQPGAVMLAAAHLCIYLYLSQCPQLRYMSNVTTFKNVVSKEVFLVISLSILEILVHAEHNLY